MYDYLIQNVEKEIGTIITSDIWTANLESIIEKSSNCIKINVKFYIEDYYFYKELKFVYEHFYNLTLINNEIVRQLKMLNDYTIFILDLLAKDYEIITDDWCLRLSEKNIVSPIETNLTFLFFKKTDSNVMFDKTINFTIDSYISKEYFDNVTANYLIKLNQPIDIDFYKNLIN